MDLDLDLDFSFSVTSLENGNLLFLDRFTEPTYRIFANTYEQAAVKKPVKGKDINNTPNKPEDSQSLMNQPGDLDISSVASSFESCQEIILLMN